MKQTTEQLFHNTEMPLIPILNEMEHVGVRCDVDQANRMELKCYKQLHEYDKFWKSKLPGVNWASPQQLIVLFEKLGLPPQYRMRVGKDKSRKRTACVDVDVLELYRDAHKCQLAGLVLQMRTLKKAADFCHIFTPDGRAHARYKDQRGGRVQARDPDLQNIPEELAGIYPRTIIIPDDPDNDVIVSADFEAIEFFIYGYAAQDEAILRARKEGIYIYGIFYEDIFKKPFFETGMPPKKMYRLKTIPPWELLVAKTGPLGMLYGRGVVSLEKGFAIPRMQATRIYNEFFAEHPGVARLHTELLKEARTYGYLKNYFGRIRRFPSVEVGRNEILSHPGQSNAADILKQNALLKIGVGIKDFGGRLLITVHDSVICSVPRRSAIGASEFIRDCMESPLPQMENYWIPAVVKIGSKETSTTGKPNWNDCIAMEDWVVYYGRAA